MGKKMKFDELQKVLEENFSTEKLSDIAHELGVTPQVVSNWKSRNQVPYKYVKLVRERIAKLSKSNNIGLIDQKSFNEMSNDADFYEEDPFLIFINYLKLLRKNYIIILLGIILFLSFGVFHNFFLKEPAHIAKAKALPVSDSSSDLSGVASAFGINVGANDKTSLVTSILYPEIIKSRRLARKLLRMDFHYGKNSAPLPLAKILSNNMNDTTSIDVLVQRYTGKLLKMITVKTTPTKLLNIEVITFDEKLSLNLVSNIISKLEELLLSFKNSELVEKKKIITSRLSILEKDLIKKRRPT